MSNIVGVEDVRIGRGGHVEIFGEWLWLELDGSLAHWSGECMDCNQEGLCYRVAFVVDAATWRGLCLSCLLKRWHQNALAIARRWVDQSWTQLPDSLWSNCDVCEELQPVDALEQCAEGWRCIGEHDE